VSDEQFHEVVSNVRDATQIADSCECVDAEGNPSPATAVKYKPARASISAAPTPTNGLEPVPGAPTPTAKLAPEAGPSSRADAGSMLEFRDRDDAEGLRPEALIGSDDRIRIRDTAHFPWRPICSLKIRTGDGEFFYGTGWLIGPKTIITAGHCLFLPSMGGWAESIEIVPGHDGHERPYGTFTSTEFRTVRGWTDNLEQRFDYGAIQLPHGQDLGKVGHFGYAVYDSASLLGAQLNVAGYPIDKPEGTLWWAARKTKRVDRGRLSYDIDTTGGQSGSPVWRLDPTGRRLVVGIHTNGTRRANSATRITDDVFANLQRWVAETREPTQVEQTTDAPPPAFP
jgi:V8-like Glu-specific endopeptidase